MDNPNSSDQKSSRTVKEDRLERMPTLPVRVASGAIFILLMVVAVFFGTYTTALLISIFSGIGAYEFYKMMQHDGKNPNFVAGTIAACAYPIAATFDIAYLTGVTFLLIIALSVEYVVNSRIRIQDIAITVFGALYTGLMLSAIVLIRTSHPELGAGYSIMLLTIGIYFSVWANDSFAYLFGSMFGRHKMVPRISPKKSWEGFLAGIIGSMVVWFTFIFIPELNISLPLALVGGLLCGLVGVTGDLVESRIKRGCGVKDSGKLIPGHGGLLDRIDSLIFVSIASYFVLRLGGIL